MVKVVDLLEGDDLVDVRLLGRLFLRWSLSMWVDGLLGVLQNTVTTW